MRNLSTYPKILLAIFFIGLTAFAVHEKHLLFMAGSMIASWLVVRNHENEKRLNMLVEAARNDANQYRAQWRLECTRHVLEKPEEKPKKRTDYKFH